jgi:hypothetical protein
VFENISPCKKATIPIKKNSGIVGPQGRSLKNISAHYLDEKHGHHARN